VPSRKESPAHLQLKEQAIKFLRATERSVKIEYPVNYPEVVWHNPRFVLPGGLIIDVVGLKNKQPQVAVEVGECERDKLIVLSKYWPEVFHCPYGVDEPIAFIPTERDKRRLKELEEEVERRREEDRERNLALLRHIDPKAAERYQRRIERYRAKKRNK